MPIVVVGSLMQIVPSLPVLIRWVLAGWCQPDAAWRGWRGWPGWGSIEYSVERTCIEVL
jgi:hypothetical protein